MLKKFVRFMQKEELAYTPILDKIIFVGVIAEIIGMLIIIALFVRLASWGMIW